MLSGSGTGQGSRLGQNTKGSIRLFNIYDHNQNLHWSPFAQGVFQTDGTRYEVELSLLYGLLHFIVYRVQSQR